MPSTLIDVPLITDSLSTAQPSIRTNFNVISVAFSQDHVNYNVTIGDGSQGMHNQVTMPRQVGDSVTAGTNVALYSKLNAAGTESSLFFRKQGNGSIIDFTSSIQASPGYFRLPSGILVKWGRTGNITNTGTFAMDVAAGIPVYTTAPFLVMFTLLTSNIPAASAYWIPGTTTTTVIGYTMSNTFTGAGTTASVAWIAYGQG